jgi:integrase
VVLKGFTRMRWGELVGLETRYVRETAIRVEWQLYELDTGELHRFPPKDDSRRTVDLPGWLARLVSDHIARIPARAVRMPPAHVRLPGTRVGRRRPSPGRSQAGRRRPRAGVSAGTVSSVLNRPELVTDATRERLEAAVAELGYVRGGPAVPIHCRECRCGEERVGPG